MVNIISGKFKNKYIYTCNFEDLKITPMFIKKKLFSWLNFDLFNFKCLDLFAGSGALGFECASRNCSFVVLVEKNKFYYKNLLKNKKNFKFENIKIYNLDYIKYLNTIKFKFYDIIFIDPPYKRLDILINSIKLSLSIIKCNGFIYIETLTNLYTLYSYFKKNLKLLKFDNFKNINFFLFKVLY